MRKKDTCPRCGSPIEYKHGKYGEFVGCSMYPSCDWSTSLEDWDECDGYPDNWLEDEFMKHNDPTNESLNG